MAKSRQELTGLEWEAEKAYIVATSPRNTSMLSSVKDSDEDDFSFEVVEVIEKKQVEENTIPTRENSNGVPKDDLHDEQTISLQCQNEDPVDNITQQHPAGITTTCTPPSSDNNAEHKVSVDTVVDTARPLSISSVSSGSRTGEVIDSAKKSVVQSESRVLVIYGPSGFGKGVLVQKMVYRSPQQFSLAVSHTTRPQRLQEMYARDFYFVSKPEMIKKIKDDKFMEYVQIDHVDGQRTLHRDYSKQNTPRESVVSLSSTTGELYGTSWESFQEAILSNKLCVVLNISTKGAEQMQTLGIDATFVLLHPGKEPEGCGTIDPNYTISIDNKEEAFGFLEEYALSVAKQDDSRYFRSPQEMNKALEEWERVPNIQLSDDRKYRRVKGGRKQHLSHKPVSFGELLNHFQNANLSEQLAKIKPETQSTFLGPPKINKRLRYERNIIFAIALCKFDDGNFIHTRSLSTIYRRLTGTSLGSTCLRFGTHWEEIGFQGSDPVDDLRGVGLLGLVQLVWLLETPLVQLIALDVYQYSRQHGQQIPFCVLLLNITCMSLQALREGCLSKECNRRDQVFAVINDFTASILLSFFHTWQKKHAGPMEVGIVLQQVGNFAKKHPRFFIKELQKYFTKMETKEAGIVAGTDGNDGVEFVEFTKLDSDEHLN